MTTLDKPMSEMRRHRERMKATGIESARALGVSHSTYQRWERGEQRPHLRTQARIAAYFSVSLHTVDQWFYDEGDCPTCSIGLGSHHGNVP